MAKNRFGIPKNIKVSGVDYEVLVVDSFSDEVDYVGLFEKEECRIKVAKVTNGGERNKSKIHETLLHEITHAIDYHFCGHVMSETEVHRLSTSMYQVLMDNELNLYRKDKKLPKRVKVGGFSYDVIFPYEFDDDPSTYFYTYHEWLEIRISDRASRNHQFLKRMLLAAVIFCICSIGELFMYNPNNNTEVRDLSSLVSGYYQVLVENKLEEIFKR